MEDKPIRMFSVSAITPQDGGLLFEFATEREAQTFYLEGKLRNNLRLQINGNTVFDSMKKGEPKPPTDLPQRD